MASGAWHYRRAEALLKAADVTSDRALANPTASAAVWGATLAAQVGGAQAHATLALAAAAAMAGLDEIAKNGEDFYDAEEDAARWWAKATNPNEAVES